ncbi:hypothetical protein F5B22DRAFT_423789 [Xylaria bambusicola]|uniref:uncharacterized protein n=1 Tax=Xylaria bambusicola TaxID=326684 RepID=UPI00200754D8|nr:uncharacterized protein F5B22DRAFT_423789 [Xylaria bambusicola]KAI0508246.1 hypothetical protein F5B22DRAFT_423789 [Xylaria bambusicola]
MPGLDIIVVGATGFVGFSVVHWAMYTSRINHIIVLTRRPMPTHVTNSAKVTVIIHQDFSDWPLYLLGLLGTAHACIWALGGHAYTFGSLDDAREATMDFPQIAAQEFAQAARPYLPHGRPFIFVYVSIRSAEWDDSKRLHYLKNTRRLKVSQISHISDSTLTSTLSASL